MSKQKTDDLIQLIRTLSRAEKRHFRLFAKRNQSSADILFLQIFDLLDQKGIYDESYLLKKIKGLKKGQLPNLKAHLKKQLLTSLRLLSSKRNVGIQIRETIDHARVLYDKGLYDQALDLLSKAKEQALSNHSTALGLEILEFEKLIDGQYITRSLEGRAEELANQTLELNERITKTNQFSNLSLRMYGLYLKYGFASSEKDAEAVKSYFIKHLPDIKFEELDFLGQVYFCQANVWLSHICLDFLNSFRYSHKWVNLFEGTSQMKTLYTAFYLKGLHNLLYSLFHNLHYERFLVALEKLKSCEEELEVSSTANIDGLYHLYLYNHLINKHYLEGTFSEGTVIIPKLAGIIENNIYNWDEHRIMVFNYRIACLYFGAKDYNRALEFLNRITQEKVSSYRSDIQCFARILSLLSHFELGNQDLMEYQIRSVYRFLLHVEELQKVQREIFHFLRKTQSILPSQIKGEFKKLLDKLKPLEKMHFESRPFLYLDIISWLEAKIEGTTIQEVIRRKFLQRNESD